MSTPDKSPPPSKPSWVQFEEGETTPPMHKTPPMNHTPTTPTTPVNNNPAIIDTQSVQVNIDNRNNNNNTNNNINSNSNITNNNTNIASERSAARTVSEPVNGVRNAANLANSANSATVNPHSGEARISMTQLSASHLHNVPLNDPSSRRPPPNHTAQPVIRQGFANGDVIVTLLPQNTCAPWITPAQFRPELVPEELMAQGLTLTVEDYVHIMSQLVNDYRFTLYNICYKRILMVWIIMAFVILLGILFSGIEHTSLFGAGIGWLLLNALAIFFSMWIKVLLNKSLELCIAGINLQLMRHKILLGLDDRGKLSCHKVNLCFIYFDPQDCIAKLQEVIEEEERAGRTVNSEENKLSTLHQRMDIDDSDIIITGATNTRISRQQNRAALLLTRYSQRWVKHVSRGNLRLSVDTGDREQGTSPPLPPRHMATRQCPCQYIEDHLHYKPQGPCQICIQMANLTPSGFSSAI